MTKQKIMQEKTWKKKDSFLSWWLLDDNYCYNAFNECTITSINYMIYIPHQEPK